MPRRLTGAPLSGMVLNMIFFFIILAMLAGCDAGPALPAPMSPPVPARAATAPIEALGRALFFDTDLSSPRGQACATCHAPDHGFTDARGAAATSQGAIPGAFGGRNAPTAAYLGAVPPLRYVAEDQTYQGGLFWDGRAGSLAEQAQGPLLNPIEMNNADAAEVLQKLRAARYAADFRRVFGDTALDEPAQALALVGQAIAAYERGPEVQRFSSKYDLYLGGAVALTASEARGLRLFEDERKGNCAACHPSQPSDEARFPLFTDFTYDNLGLPRNPQNPIYGQPGGASFEDRGLGQTLGDPAHDGKFKVPTLRNIALTAPYGHNGYFADLRAVVQFYNTRDTQPGPPPEFPQTMNRKELGALGLTDDEVDDIVAFLRTLTDGYRP